MQGPREPHLKATYHVLRYLKGDPNLGIILPIVQIIKSKFSMTQIGQLNPCLENQLVNTLYCLETTPLIENQRNSPLSHSPLPKLNIYQLGWWLDNFWLAKHLAELIVLLYLPISIFCDS